MYYVVRATVCVVVVVVLDRLGDAPLFEVHLNIQMEKFISFEFKVGESPIIGGLFRRKDMRVIVRSVSIMVESM